MLKTAINGIQFIAERFAALITVAACVALVVATLHIVADVFMSRFFRSPIIGTHDIVTTYYMVSLFFLPLAYAESRGAHIKADLFFTPLPFAVRWCVSMVTYLSLSGFLSVLTWQMTLRAIRQTNIGDMRLIGDFYLLLWPSRWLAVLGIAAFTIIAVIRTLSLLVPGGYDNLERRHDDA
ncbi:TRAP transporter small permease subunit [Roseinatronobacter alkalisoli]|uniref:TRAP transporter small permease protein n=1 Tax=Roseinatronobacter alkalisoli TaxID=3028235 RepID=A0ABT5TAM6_9RHOB|nr:TRAP transporter small permease [Roseinatronobacter sp. HJB301]MDD7972178.1 TRAP transporter small permease [Roseinatronobacter sp. HJB301]